MFVTSSAIQNGAFEDKYGKRGTQFSPNGMPTYSIPFEIHDAPQGTKSFAVVLEDKDAITASGFVWIHWLIADLERTVIQENESQTSFPVQWPYQNMRRNQDKSEACKRAFQAKVLLLSHSVY